MANASFGGVSFDAMGPGIDFPQPDRRNTLPTRKVPYGSRTIEQDLGPEAVEISYEVELTAATYAALDALRLARTLATLTVGTDPAHPGTRLRYITNRSVDGIGNDLRFATLTFLVP